MRYVGLQTQISRNNRWSVILLVMFPTIILGMVWLFLALTNYYTGGYTDLKGRQVHQLDVDVVNGLFMETLPWVVGVVSVWFAIAYFSHSFMIRHATGAHPVSRKDNPRIYNIVENLCMSVGMDMPKIQVVDDPQLNAFASGINRETYAVTFTTGLLERLDDEELAGVAGHELTHIRNRDTRLLIVSVVFVGIISTVMTMLVRQLYYVLMTGDGRRRSNRNGNGGASVLVVLLIAVVCCAIAYLFTVLTRFAISRKREYMADAGGAELCGNPRALASALRKIALNPGLDDVKREDVSQMFIMRPDEMSWSVMSLVHSLFSTHPDPEKRIEILEQF